MLMPRIHNSVVIEESLDRVFSFITNTANCNKWYPCKLCGITNQALQLGDRFVEDFNLAGRQSTILWTVSKCVPPYQWTLAGHSDSGGEATLAYNLAPSSMGTRLQRTFSYSLAALLGPTGSFFSVQDRFQAEYAEALRKLKRVLESEVSAA
jgi:hypothetical protein